MNATIRRNTIQWQRPHVTPLGYPSPAALADAVHESLYADLKSRGNHLPIGSMRAILEGIWTAFNEADATGADLMAGLEAADARFAERINA